MHNTEFLSQLTAAGRRAEVTATVCIGSTLLARTGRLDARPATSHKLAWEWVRQGKWIRQARWVDDGDIITASGVSSGIDMALSLIARLYSCDVALKSARNMVYRWHEEACDDPFA